MNLSSSIHPASPGQQVTRRHALVALCILALSIAVHLPSVWRGFQYDDHIHQFMMRYGMGWPDASPARLYDFSFWISSVTAQDMGSLVPWWTDADFKLAFLRPVTSLTLWLDHTIYGGWAPGYHLTSLALFAALGLLIYRLFLALGAPSRAALWALAFYMLSGNHSLPVDWIANRNELCSSLCVVAMMLQFIRYRCLGGRLRLASSVALYLLACLSKESGLVGLPLVGLYLLTLDGDDRSEPLRSRCLRVARSPVLWLFVAITAAYLACYVATGHGTTSSNYATPSHRTGVYVERVATLVPLAFGSLFFGISTDLVFTRPGLFWPIIALDTVLVALLLSTLWHRLRTRPPAWFAGGWIVAALLPSAGVTLSDRLLMSAAVGSALMLGLLMDSLASPRAMFATPRSRVVGGVFIVFGLIVAVPSGWVRSTMFSRMAAADRTGIVTAEIPAAAGTPRQTVILLNCPSALMGFTLQPTWAVCRNDTNTTFYILSMARRATTVLREDDRTLLVTYGDPPLLVPRFERIFHTTEEPPPPGQVFRTAAFAATVVSTGDSGIRSVRFRFPNGIEGSPVRFLAWRSGAFRRTELPKAGDTLALPPPVPTVPWVP